MPFSRHLTRRQWFSVIISGTIASIVIVVNVINVIESYFWKTVTDVILIAIAIGLPSWGFRIPSKRISKILNYYIALLPMLFALTIIALVYELQQIPELRAKIDPLFSVGLWFVVISSVSALVVIINTDLRIDKLEKKLLSEENSKVSTPTLNNSKQLPTHKNKLERASQIAAIVSAIALVFAGGALYYNYNEETIIEKQFKIENIPAKIPSLIASDVDIQNLTYDKYPLTEKISISIISTHLLEIDVKNINFSSPYGPYGNFHKKPEIFMRQVVEKYLDKGVSNLEVEVPFNLTLATNELHPFEKNTTWAGIPITTQLMVTDLQNGSDTGQIHLLYSYLGIKGEYLPKQVTDAPSSTDTVTATKNKSIK